MRLLSANSFFHLGACTSLTSNAFTRFVNSSTLFVFVSSSSVSAYTSIFCYASPPSITIHLLLNRRLVAANRVLDVLQYVNALIQLLRRPLQLGDLVVQLRIAPTTRRYITVQQFAVQGQVVALLRG